MNSSRKVFFYLLLVVATVVVGVVMQFFLAQSKNQTAINTEQVYALQQVHADTLVISNALYLGDAKASQQLQVHLNTMEKQLRQFNQQSGLLQSEAARKAAADESVEMNHAWFSLSQLLNKLQGLSSLLIAQRESKNLLVVHSSEMQTQIDDVALALGRESRLKDSVPSALSYVDLMAEVSTARSSLFELQEKVQQIGEIKTEPLSLSEEISDNLKVVESSIEALANDSDRIVKSKLIEFLEARDAFVAETGRWSENLSTLSDAFLTSNAIQQRSEDFNLQLKTKLRNDGKSRHNNLLKLLAYALPILGAILLLIGGRRYIQSTSTHLAIAQGTVEANAENAQQTEELRQRVVSFEQQNEQLKTELQTQAQKMQAIASDADRYLSDLESFNSKLGAVEVDAEGAKQENKELRTKLRESKANEEKYRLYVASHRNELQSVKLNAKQLEQQNHEVVRKLQKSESIIEKMNDNDTLNELDATKKELAEINGKASELSASINSVEARASELQTQNKKLEHEIQLVEEVAEKYQLEASAYSKEKDALILELEKLDASKSETESFLERKSADFEDLKKEKNQLDSEVGTQQENLDYLFLGLERIEEDFSQRLELDNVATSVIAKKINTILDVSSDSWSEVSLLGSRLDAVAAEIQELYVSDETSEENAREKIQHFESLQSASQQLVESLNKLSLGSTASAEIVAETSEMVMQGVGSMRVINTSLNSTASTINNMLPSLERLTENAQLMKSVVELLDSISQQAQSSNGLDIRTGLSVTVNDHDNIDSKYDLFENFRMATSKMTELISEVVVDVEGLANSIKKGMDDVQDSSVHGIAMTKLMKQVKATQSQLSRLIQALLAQTSLQTNAVRELSDHLDEVSIDDRENSDEKLNKETVEQLVELSDQLKAITQRDVH